MVVDSAVVKYSNVKVFSATKSRERGNLGEGVTAWIEDRKGIQIVDAIVKQSSDSAYHCLSIILFYK